MIGRAMQGALLPLVVLLGCQSVEEEPAQDLDAQHWMAAKGDIYRELALRALRSGDPDRTRQLLAEALQFQSDDVDSLQLMARLSLAAGELVEAKTYARWWLDLEPYSVSALCLSGIIEESLGNHAEAEAFFRKAAVVDDGDPQPLIDLHTFLLNRGKEDEATALRERVLERFPDCHEVLLDYGAYLEFRGRWDEALAAFQQARELRPDDLEIAIRVGTTALLGGRDDVLIDLERQLPPRARVEDASLALLLATMRLRDGDEVGGLQELDLLREPGREDPVVWLLRGEILLGRQDLGGAEGAFREALLGDERIARAHAGLGRVHLARDQYVAAGRALQQAIELDPGNAVSRALMAVCRAQVGDLEQAREHLLVARGSGQAADLVAEIERRYPALAASQDEEQVP